MALSAFSMAGGAPFGVSSGTTPQVHAVDLVGKTGQAGIPMTVTEKFVETAIAASEARSDARVNSLEGRISTTNATLGAVKDRLDDLSNRFASVPTDLATLKTQVAHLPTKDDMRQTMRNWVLLGSSLTTVLLAALGLIARATGVF